MNQKTIYILAGILIILGTIAAQPIYTPYLKQYLPVIFAEKSEFPHLNPDTISQVLIKAEETVENPVTLKNNNNTWTVNNQSIDKTKITQFLAQLQQLSPKVTQLVSKNPENHSIYEVDESQASILEITQDDQIHTILVGKPGITINSFYVRLQDDPKTYLTQGSLPEIISIYPLDWRDKTIVNLSPENIHQIEITRGISTIVITKNEDGKWQASQGIKTAVLGDELSSRLVNSFTPLEASALADQEAIDSYNDQSVQGTVEILDSSTTSLAKITLKDIDGNWYLQPEGQEEVYTLSSALVSDFFLKPDDIFTNWFVKTPLPPQFATLVLCLLFHPPK